MNSKSESEPTNRSQLGAGLPQMWFPSCGKSELGSEVAKKDHGKSELHSPIQIGTPRWVVLSVVLSNHPKRGPCCDFFREPGPLTTARAVAS